MRWGVKVRLKNWLNICVEALPEHLPPPSPYQTPLIYFTVMSHAEVSIEMCARWNSRCILQWIFQQPVMIEPCSNFSNTFFHWPHGSDINRWITHWQLLVHYLLMHVTGSLERMTLHIGHHILLLCIAAWTKLVVNSRYEMFLSAEKTFSRLKPNIGEEAWQNCAELSERSGEFRMDNRIGRQWLTG